MRFITGELRTTRPTFAVDRDESDPPPSGEKMTDENVWSLSSFTRVRGRRKSTSADQLLGVGGRIKADECDGARVRRGCRRDGFVRQADTLAGGDVNLLQVVVGLAASVRPRRAKTISSSLTHAGDVRNSPVRA
jgi:hypothetical protein